MTATQRPLAMVTGASSGIGYELARQFLSNGFDTVMVADGEDIRHAADSLSGLGGIPTPLQIDLADRHGPGTLQSAVSALHKPLEAAAINAGIGVGGPFIETDLAQELRIIDLNVASTVAIAKWAARDMAARDRGRILFTSSIIARTPAPFQAIYGASKAFVQSFGQALRNELKDTGVTVTMLLPGPRKPVLREGPPSGHESGGGREGRCIMSQQNEEPTAAEDVIIPQEDALPSPSRTGHAKMPENIDDDAR